MNENPSILSHLASVFGKSSWDEMTGEERNTLGNCIEAVKKSREIFLDSENRDHESVLSEFLNLVDRADGAVETGAGNGVCEIERSGELLASSYTLDVIWRIVRCLTSRTKKSTSKIGTKSTTKKYMLKWLILYQKLEKITSFRHLWKDGKPGEAGEGKLADHRLISFSELESGCELLMNKSSDYREDPFSFRYLYLLPRLFEMRVLLRKHALLLQKSDTGKAISPEECKEIERKVNKLKIEVNERFKITTGRAWLIQDTFYIIDSNTTERKAQLQLRATHREIIKRLDHFGIVFRHEDEHKHSRITSIELPVQVVVKRTSLPVLTNKTKTSSVLRRLLSPLLSIWSTREVEQESTTIGGDDERLEWTTAVIVGPYYMEFSSGGIVLPRLLLGSNLGRVCGNLPYAVYTIPISSSSSAEESYDSFFHTLRDLCLKWNCEKVYHPKKANSQHFLDDVLMKLGLLSEYRKSYLAPFMSNVRRHGSAPMEFYASAKFLGKVKFKMPPEMRKRYRLLGGGGGQIVEFSSHLQLDTFANACMQANQIDIGRNIGRDDHDPSWSSSKSIIFQETSYEFNLLITFDRAFWFEYFLQHDDRFKPIKRDRTEFDDFFDSDFDDFSDEEDEEEEFECPFLYPNETGAFILNNWRIHGRVVRDCKNNQVKELEKSWIERFQFIVKSPYIRIYELYFILP